MLLAVLSMLAGILAGAIAARRGLHTRFARPCAALQSAGSAALMLCVGVGLGSHGEFWESLSTAGIAGILLALASTLGGILAVYPLSKGIFQR